MLPKRAKGQENASNTAGLPTSYLENRGPPKIDSLFISIAQEARIQLGDADWKKPSYESRALYKAEQVSILAFFPEKASPMAETCFKLFR